MELREKRVPKLHLRRIPEVGRLRRESERVRGVISGRGLRDACRAAGRGAVKMRLERGYYAQMARQSGHPLSSIIAWESQDLKNKVC